ncbi:gamma-glutamyl-gamma-aminobutyrate hydrolase family protein [Elongatibacter sediminis]|uniref:Type 1 glutamine amidotransferase n=1 Tax=Elongatibacter sediminis TaxID=3119006 RepID=A0AAW9REC7_9GAMM
MAEKLRRPVIGITGPRSGSIGPRACIQVGVWLAGGRAVQLRPGDAFADHRLDGLVISGGHDVEPVLYKAEAEVQGNYDPERDRFEGAMIDRGLERGIPILGICRGAQLLNVHLGGSLFQDLRKRRRSTSHRRTLLPLKTLCLRRDTLLHRITARDTMKINSLHNQAIDRLGAGLRVSGTDLDDIVQAVEDAGHPFRVGVQWHPEFLLYLGAHRRVFRALVRAAGGSGV